MSSLKIKRNVYSSGVFEETPKPLVQTPLSVSEFTLLIKRELESAHPLVCIQGEVSNCKAQASGHWYFSLKDAEAQISCACFRLDAARIGKMPKDGDHLIIKGALNLFPPSGKYQIVVRDIQQVGLGALLLQLEALKKRLQEKGYFAQARKKPIPPFPKTILVITSPTGAVIQDIIHVLTRRLSSFHLILIPTKVQGQGAKEEIAEAIALANQYRLGDVIILARGGGSIEDLWPFNEEIVVEAIYQSQIPLISAIGHETDFTMSDFVADLRAPTPSVAAELVSQETATLIRHLRSLYEMLSQKILFQLRQEKTKLLSLFRHPLLASPYALLGPQIQKADTLAARIERENPFIKIPLQKNELYLLQKNLNNTIYSCLRQKKDQLATLIQLLVAYNPKEILKKGYTLIFSEKEGTLIKGIAALKKGAQISLLFSGGKASAEITAIYKEELSHEQPDEQPDERQDE